MADDATVIRLLTFRTVGPAPALDVALRTDALPGLEPVRGLVDAYAGRHGAADSGDRIIVTTWRSRGSMDEAFRTGDVDRLIPDHAEQVRDARVETLDLVFGFRLERPAPPRVLRVFHGEVRPDDLDAYAEQVREGALRDARTTEGMLALYFAVERPARFLTVSLWADWDSIQHATGATVREPTTTRDGARVVAATAVHYEVVPDTERPNRSAAVAPDLTRSR